ncbi:MAG: DUF5714 domain-containing protein [Candidatus Bathyarchaeia archaeon]|jgi:hypothetical protein
MSHKRSGCVVCGDELVYGQNEKLECFYCHEILDSNVKCRKGHYVCDKCHSMPGNDLIENFCSTSKITDPLELALILLRNPKIKMHGPEHHFLVPAVLLAAYYNAKGDYAQKRLKIKEARSRSSKILGGFCGFYGDCGAAVGTGIFMSLITNATPLSSREWKLSNLITAKSLLTIADHGGPRCCKRNTFLAINQTVNFLKENFSFDMKINRKVKCEFKDLNKECLKQKCPYHLES